MHIITLTGFCENVLKHVFHQYTGHKGEEARSNVGITDRATVLLSCHSRVCCGWLSTGMEERAGFTWVFAGGCAVSLSGRRQWADAVSRLAPAGDRSDCGGWQGTEHYIRECTHRRCAGCNDCHICGDYRGWLSDRQ